MAPVGAPNGRADCPRGTTLRRRDRFVASDASMTASDTDDWPEEPCAASRAAGSGNSTSVDAIEAESLVKTYPGDVRALDGLTFSVAENTVFGLLGPNGAGKTTAVKILTTLSRADSGTARVTGLDVVREAGSVRHAIGVVQQKHGVDIALTGRENLRLQGRIFGMRGRALEARARHLLDQVGLAGAADRVARGYSGGMQRRLDIAMALVHRPRVL